MAIVFGEALRRALSFYEWFVSPIDCLTRKMEVPIFLDGGVSTTCVRFQNVGIIVKKKLVIAFHYR